MLVPVARAFRILSGLCLACVSASHAGNGLLPDGHLDTAAVRDGYLRADMPFVRAALEGFIKSHPREVGTDEKVFTHLYLGAVYAGEKDGRNRAEAHFRAALKLDPYSDPANLYLPPAIKTWFERLRADVLRAQAQESPADPESVSATPAPEAAMQRDMPMQREAPPPPRQTPSADTPAISVRAPDPDPDGSRESASGAASGPSPEAATVAPSPSRSWVWWTLGTAAAAGAGALTWAELGAKPKPRHVQVDATLK